MGAAFDHDSITAVSARIEEVIRAHMAHMPADYVDDVDSAAGNVRSMVMCAADPLIESAVLTLEGREGVWEPEPERRREPLWADLRPSEAVKLRDLVGAAIDRAAARASDAIVEELAAAALEWYQEHPEARWYDAA